MEDNFYQTLAYAMKKIESESPDKVYWLNSDINDKAAALYHMFLQSFPNANIIYSPAYLQIIVTADTYLLAINKECMQHIFNADIFSVDSSAGGMLHIECIFNKAFKIVGELNE